MTETLDLEECIRNFPEDVACVLHDMGIDVVEFTRRIREMYVG